MSGIFPYTVFSLCHLRASTQSESVYSRKEISADLDAFRIRCIKDEGYRSAFHKGHVGFLFRDPLPVSVYGYTCHEQT